MRNIVSTIIQVIGIAVGLVLFVLGGFMGLEGLQAPGPLNLPIMVFALAGLILGSIIFWLVFKKHKNI